MTNLVPKRFYNMPIRYKFHHFKYDVYINGTLYPDGELDWKVRDINTSHTELLNAILHELDEQNGAITALIIEQYEQEQKENQL